MTSEIQPDAAGLLAAYDAQLRTSAEMHGADRVDRFGPVWAGEYDDGSWGFVSYQNLKGYDGARLDDLIGQVVAHYRDDTHVERFEWKTRGHDLPADLTERLAAQGFAPEDVETVMVGAATGVAAGPDAPAGIVIRQVGADGHDRAVDLARGLAMQQEVFGGTGTGIGSVANLERSLDADPGAVSFWLAEDGDTVVTAGRINIVSGTEFAGIWGGATRPHWRGRGIYRALTAARARWAIERGVRYLHSDSTDMSKPILERSGLVAVTTTTPYIWQR